MKTALTIAGTDSSGGAGVQADIKTMTANGVYAMSAVTALTAQNTTGVYGILESTPEFLRNQLDCIFTDIRPDAVKIGMLSSSPLIEVIADSMRKYDAKNIVLDPVMVSTSGSRLISEDAVETLERELLPLATVLTPNIPEAEVLSGLRIENKADMERAAEAICDRYRCAVLLKGGHDINDAKSAGLSVGASSIPTHTARAARCPAPLLPTWQRAMVWRRRWSAPRPISPMRWRRCWTWAQGVGR